MRRATVPLLVALLLLVAMPGARADGYGETEYRLKTAGVEPSLRSRIHRAIDRSVAWLQKRQRRDGSVDQDPGRTALVGLALRHAATPEAVAAGRRALAWLDEVDVLAERWDPVRTYTVGLTAMLRQADGRSASDLQPLCSALAQGPARAAGYWDYAPRGGGGGPNLSTAQFGALGLWAAERAGASAPKEAWRRHLDALLDAQLPDGSWPYWAPGTPQGSAGGAGYPTGTFMGLANLVLATTALEGDLARDPGLLARSRVALGRGRAALRRHLAWIDAAPALDIQWALRFYRLYALEKVCIFLDEEEIAGRRWYRRAALQLVETQARDGHWGGPLTGEARIFTSWVDKTVQTAFGLLVLLRGSQVYHPTTPRPPAGLPVVTPGPVPAPPAVPNADEALLNSYCDRLELALDSSRMKDLRGTLDALDSIGDLCLAGRRTPEGEKAVRRAHAVLLRLAGRFARPSAESTAAWQAVALGALDAYEGYDPPASLRLMRLVDSLGPTPAFSVEFQPAWYAAALEALVRLETRNLDAWLVDRCLDPAPGARARASAALVTLGGLPLTGPERHAALTAILSTLDPGLDDDVIDVAKPDLVRDLLVAAHVLAGPRAKGFPSIEPSHWGDVSATRKKVRRWWTRHKSAADRLWRDE